VNLDGTNSLHYGAMILKSWCDMHACEDTMHHANVVWCSWCMLAWLGYPENELVIETAITGWEGVCVVSRILTTKIPSALLVAIIWLQRTWCPRFCRGTFGYRTSTSPIIRRIEYEYWNLSCGCTLVHPRFPNACAMQMHAQKWHLF
jgi:hypothetical protein